MDQVMGMLYVLFLAKNPKFNEIANEFASSNATEIGKLRRFAKKLISLGKENEMFGT
jgi:hypothetical protein